MKKLRVYFETTLFGFYYDTLIQNLTKREATQRLFEQLKSRQWVGLVSGVVIQELEQTPEPHRKDLLKLLQDYPFSRLEYDPVEAQHLAELYLKAGIIPDDFPKDALHVAIATVAEIDVLVTWNCKHLANEFRARQIRAINLREGYVKELSIRTAEEVILYAD